MRAHARSESTAVTSDAVAAALPTSASQRSISVASDSAAMNTKWTSSSAPPKPERRLSAWICASTRLAEARVAAPRRVLIQVKEPHDHR